MKSQAPDTQKIKFGEWRPIGVCDDGDASRMKALIFDYAELAIVTQPRVSRKNWQSQRSVIRMLRKKSKKLAQLSLQTEGMKNPQIKSIEVVGAVLGHEDTPFLNKESNDGRVQFFQISFFDAPKRTFPWRTLIALITTVLVLWGALLLSQLDLSDLDKKSVKFCGEPVRSELHEKHIKSAKDQVNGIFHRFGKQNRCYFTSGDIRLQEKQYLKCFRELKEKLPQTLSASKNQRLKKCAIRLCRQSGGQFPDYCQ